MGAALQSVLNQAVTNSWRPLAESNSVNNTIDGKYLRGSANAEHEALDILNAFSHELGVVLGQRVVGDKTNEIPEIIPLLEVLTLTGKLVTGDALHTQRDTA